MNMPEIYLGRINTRLGNHKIPLVQRTREFKRNFAQSKQTTGVNHLCEFDTSQDLILESANCAKESAKGLDIEGIVGAQCTPSSEYSLPTYTSQVAHTLGLEGPSLNCNYGCAGLAYALKSARNQVLVNKLLGKESSYLVVVGDHVSRILPNEWSCKALFSDAVATCVVSSSPLEYELNAVEIKQLPGKNPFCMSVKKSDGLFFMEGKDTYRFVKESVYPAFKQMTPEIDPSGLLIPHSASNMSIQALKKEVGGEVQLYERGMESGNKQVASTLFGLKEVGRSYKTIYLLPFGAELAVGSVTLKSV